MKESSVGQCRTPTVTLLISNFLDIIFLPRTFRLLSPQVLIDTFGGKGIMKGSGIDFELSDGNRFSASLCPRSNLPLIPLATHPSRNFWSEAFGYTLSNVQAIQEIKSILSDDNSNLSSPQKELLLWHQRLSHASLDWTQMLMRDRLGCLLLSNSNLLLGVQYIVTVITYCNYCGYCQFFK